MDEQDYLKNRVDDQIGWYDRKSKFNQRNFKIVRLVEIVLSASIAVLALMIPKPKTSVI